MTADAEQVVLVVDDTPANVRLLEAVLGPSGYRVVTATSGEEALAAARAEAPDVVLLDIQMPGMNGYEVCRRLREDPATAAVPVVMITAAIAEEKVRAIEAGADDFVLRPFDRAELLARVRSLVRVKQSHDTIAGQAAELAAWAATLEARVEEQLAELEQLRRLRRFLPAQLADAVLAAGDPDVLEPHRREVALLVCRLCGFGRLSAESAPEEAVLVLREYHEVLGRLVETHGAAVGWLGAGMVTLIFNDPVPHAAPTRAAATLAMDLQSALEPVLDDWERRGHRLGVASAIAFGFATLGTVGFEGRYDYTPIGPVVNQAGRLAAGARSGDVLLSPRAAVELDGIAELEAVDEGGAAPAFRLRSIEPGARAAAPIELDLLGPLTLRHDGQPVELRASRERQVLALLAVHHGSVVTVEQLADEIWDGAPSDSAVAALRVHVSRLRKTLSTAGIDDVLSTEAAGYVLRLGDASAIDSNRFADLAAEGRAQLAAGDHEAASETLRRALALWRGGVLPDVPPMASLNGVRLRLEELRLAATEDRIDADLAGGRHREVLAELEELTSLHPLRERFLGQRMLALYRSGRQAEALRAFQTYRTRLIDDAGLEPSAELHRLEQEILAQAPGLGLRSTT